MSDREYPEWWPRCLYPDDVFPMTVEQYIRIVRDPDVRTAISGCLARVSWTIASEAIFDAMVQHQDEVSNGH